MPPDLLFPMFSVSLILKYSVMFPAISVQNFILVEVPDEESDLVNF